MIRLLIKHVFDKWIVKNTLGGHMFGEMLIVVCSIQAISQENFIRLGDHLVVVMNQTS